MRLSKKGILLINTGSPSAPTVREVRRYLGQFLMDPYVIDLPFWKRWLLVHGIILRTRPAHSARAYQAIWTPEGSPLVSLTRRQCTELARLTGLPVAMGFRYGTPSIEEGFNSLLAQGCEPLCALPLFPQYSRATTESIRVELLRISGKATLPHKLEILPPFWNAPAYLEAWVRSVQTHLPRQGEHLLISFHGLPERHLRQADPSGHTCLERADCCTHASGEVLDHCYRAQSIRMTQHLVSTLGLRQDQYTLAYQSRLGRDPWLAPSTQEVALALAQKGIKHLAVVTPSFISDCLETLYEIEIELRSAFLSAGGETFDYIPCLNESIEWMAKLTPQ